MPFTWALVHRYLTKIVKRQRYKTIITGHRNNKMWQSIRDWESTYLWISEHIMKPVNLISKSSAKNWQKHSA